MDSFNAVVNEAQAQQKSGQRGCTAHLEDHSDAPVELWFVFDANKLDPTSFDVAAFGN